MSSAIQNILVLGGIVLIVGFGYYLFVQDGSVNTHNMAVENQAAVETDEFLLRLKELETINLDSTIFTDPRFTTLTTYTFDPEPEPYSKANPFD